jgi:hypothetical protein
LTGWAPSELIVNLPDVKSAVMFPPEPLPAPDAWQGAGLGAPAVEVDGAGVVDGADVVDAPDGSGDEEPDEHPAARRTTAAAASRRAFGTGHHPSIEASAYAGA